MRKILYSLVVIALISCNKAAFLSKKPNQSHVVPKSLQELQAVLDRDVDMNGLGNAGRGPVPNLGEIGSDSYYVPDVDLSRMKEEYKNCYLWATDPYVEPQLYSWEWPYKAVFLSNIVLDGLNEIDKHKGTDGYGEILGSALFYRAHTFYQLAQVFAPHYQKETAEIDKGIPLRLTSDVGEDLPETTVRETYDRIILDLNRAKDLLPENVPVKSRPSKQAAYALLSRVYLNMQDYDLALLYADSCLQIQPTLLDYNLLVVESDYPFLGLDQNNPEIIFSCNLTGQDFANFPIRPQVARIDSTLYKLYNETDLRKKVLFKEEENGMRFKGSYDGSDKFFGGIATDEIYLIRAECNARLGRLEQATADLNLLMANRWSVNSEHHSFDASNKEELVKSIFLERRKELLFRGLRWVDLRRLNLEGENIILKRKVDGEVYILLPDDRRYTWPFPNEVLAFGGK